MLSVSQGFKDALQNNVIYSDSYIVVYDVDESTNVTIDSEEIQEIEITSSSFVNEKVIGNVVSYLMTIRILGDATSSINLTSEKHIEPYIGVLVNGVYEYVKYQKFIVDEVKYDDTTNLTTIKGVDFLYKSNVEFSDTNTYPITLFELAQSVATFLGLEIENTGIVNGSFSIAEKRFPSFESCRNILSKIAELSGCFVRINKVNGKIEFVNAFPDTSIEDLHIDSDNYFKLTLKDNRFGLNGVNTLLIGYSFVDGENNTKVNQPNVAIDGNIEVQVLDNEIVNTEEKRLLVLDNLFGVVDGFKYQPFEMEYIGYPHIEIGDVVEFEKKDLTLSKGVITDFLIKYDGGLYGTIKGKSLSKVQKSYHNQSTNLKRVKNAEFMVDKANAEISLIATEVGIIDGKVNQNTNSIIVNSQEIALKATTQYVDNKIAEINQASPNRVSNLPVNYEQGDIVSGVDTSSNFHIRTRSFYPIRTGFVTVQIADLYEAKVVLYDSSYNYVSTTQWGDLYTFQLSTPSFFKVVVRSKTSNQITPSEIETSQLKVANESTATAWNLYFGDLTLEQQRELYNFYIVSRNGLTFDGDTSLTVDAVVLLDGVEVTEMMENNQFSWTRISKDSVKDSQFNNLGITGRSLTVTQTYLDRTATYQCVFSIPETAYILTKGGDRILTKADNYYLVAIISEV